MAGERPTLDREASKVSLCAHAPTDLRARAKLSHLEHLAELKKVPAPPCKPGGIRERAYLSVFRSRVIPQEEAA